MILPYSSSLSAGQKKLVVVVFLCVLVRKKSESQLQPTARGISEKESFGSGEYACVLVLLLLFGRLRDDLFLLCAFFINNYVAGHFSLANKYQLFIIVVIQLIAEKMNQAKDLLKQMMETCVSPQEANSRGKEMEKICQQMVDQLQMEPARKITLHFKFGVGKPTDSFIIKCLLFILIRQRSLRLEIAFRFNISKEDNTIDLRVDNNLKLDISKEFLEKLQIYRRRTRLSSIDHFFEVLSVRCNDLTNENNRRSLNTIRLCTESHFFIASFLEQFNNLFEKKVYFLRTGVRCLGDEQSFASETQNATCRAIYSRMIAQFQKIYTLTEYISGTRNNLLKDHLQQDKRSAQQVQVSKDQQQQQEELGYFKQFSGTRTQFLQNLYIKFSGTEEELHTISDFLKLTPNLASLKLVANQAKIYPNINQLLESILSHTPLLKIFSFQNSTIQSLPNELLLRLYEGCPFLVELEIKINFKFAVSETYQFNGPEDRQQKERQRQAQIILEALRLRNITLSHNSEMIQLLLKKGFSFIAALEIADCIETVCI